MGSGAGSQIERNPVMPQTGQSLNPNMLLRLKLNQKWSDDLESRGATKSEHWVRKWLLCPGSCGTLQTLHIELLQRSADNRKASSREVNRKRHKLR
jgi:hypothetical protein